MVYELVLQHDPDVLVLTETGSDNSPETLVWLTRKLRPQDNITTTNVHTHFNDLSYHQIISSDGSVEGERGGIVTLIHNRWRHRRVGKIIHDTHKRWLAFDIRTPLGRTSIIAAYMKHSPGSNQAILKEWDELLDFIVHRKTAKNKRRVILLGDLNISRNPPQTRSVVASHFVQEEILHRLDSVGVLTDIFPHRYPDKQYCTYQQRNREGDVLSWSGIDHIMVSHQHAHRITSSTISNAPTVDSTLDHLLLYTHIAMAASPIAARDFTRPAFDIKRKAEYASLTEDTLNTFTPPEMSGLWPQGVQTTATHSQTT
jgi:exonuclease III